MTPFRYTGYMSTPPRPRSLAAHLASLDLSEATVMEMSLREANDIIATIRERHGFARKPAPLFTAPDGNAKLAHSSSDNVLAYGLFLLPAALSGWNVCDASTPGCRALCLNLAGQGGMAVGQRGRAWKTALLAEEPVAFLRRWAHELRGLRRVVDSAPKGWRVSFRPNGTSDLPWERIAPWIIARTAETGATVYDYTKLPHRERGIARAGLAGVYDVSYSVSERSTPVTIRAAARPVVVVATRKGEAFPTTAWGRPVVSGDTSDFRPGDAADSVVFLRYKRIPGMPMAAAVATGFVRTLESIPA